MSSAAPLHDVVDADEEAVASAHDNGDVIPSEEGKCGLCQKLFIDSGNDKKVLHLMSIGVSADNKNVKPLFSFECEPWSLLPKTVGMRPCNTDYLKEIVRQAELFHVVPVPLPSNDEVDIRFLRGKVLRLRNVLERRVQEQQALVSVGDGNGTRGGSGQWEGCVPYLCVIMCLTQDSVKCLFLTRANSRSRLQLDARHCDNR